MLRFLWGHGGSCRLFLGSPPAHPLSHFVADDAEQRQQRPGGFWGRQSGQKSVGGHRVLGAGGGQPKGPGGVGHPGRKVVLRGGKKGGRGFQRASGGYQRASGGYQRLLWLPKGCCGYQRAAVATKGLLWLPKGSLWLPKAAVASKGLLVATKGSLWLPSAPLGPPCVLCSSSQLFHESPRPPQKPHSHHWPLHGHPRAPGHPTTLTATPRAPRPPQELHCHQ